MCTLSNKLKLCTCSKDEIECLQHYWVLHRFVAEKREIVWGMIMPPYGMRFLDIEQNKVMLLDLLNEGKAFDFEVELEDTDLLHIAIGLDDGQKVDYGFEFKKGRWKEKEYHVFEWMEQHEEVMSGKVKGVILQ